MITRIPFARLGHFRNEWLDSHFHFDFSGTDAPMGGHFGPLRVWNDDEIKADTGFDLHGHRNMEIVTYVRRGAISHRDDLGNEGRTPAGDVQVMTAGTGIRHAEWNRESDDTLIYQIWVEPNRLNLAPAWDQAAFPKADRAGQLVPLASGQAGSAAPLYINQDATLYGAMVKQGGTLVHNLAKGRRAYLVVADGAASVNGTVLQARDGAAITELDRIELVANDNSEILLFDLP